MNRIDSVGRACESESSEGATEFSPRRQPWVPAKKSSQAPTGRHKKIRSGMSVAPLGLMIFTARNPGLTPRAIPSRPFGALMNRRQVCPPPLGQAHFGVLRQSGASTELSRFICSRCAVFGWLDGINREPYKAASREFLNRIPSRENRCIRFRLRQTSRQP